MATPGPKRKPGRPPGSKNATPQQLRQQAKYLEQIADLKERLQKLKGK